MFTTDFSHYDFQVQLLLTLIALFAITFLLFFVLTYINRYKRIKKTELKAVYQKKIDQLFFTLLFEENRTVSEAAEVFKKEIIPTKLIKKMTLKSINSLHRNYTGELKQKLEEFYVESNLVQYSLKKMDSLNWAKVVEAIRDLSNLNFQEAYQSIYSKLDHSKKIVQKEAFIGMILLKGLNELIKLKDSPIYIDDWTQSNILYVVKRDKMKAPENIELLLTSKNESIVLLAARIIQYFQLVQHSNALEHWVQKNPNSIIQSKISAITTQLNTIHEAL